VRGDGLVLARTPRCDDRADEDADDWIPLSEGAVRPTQGKTLAVMQVSGGSQSFNAVNQMRVLGRWMRMLTIPNQSSIPKAFQEFDEAGRMRPSPLYDRIVDVMEELMKFTLLTRDRADYLVDRYSERKESAEALMKRVNLSRPRSAARWPCPSRIGASGCCWSARTRPPIWTRCSAWGLRTSRAPFRARRAFSR
jgi:hypothetical protein